VNVEDRVKLMPMIGAGQGHAATSAVSARAKPRR
jgi:hypothetical protein